jgi:hypothetical protein
VEVLLGECTHADQRAGIPKVRRSCSAGSRLAVLPIDDLLVAYRGWDNFNTEPSRARLLERVVGDITVPAAVRSDYVLALVR